MEKVPGKDGETMILLVEQTGSNASKEVQNNDMQQDAKIVHALCASHSKIYTYKNEHDSDNRGFMLCVFDKELIWRYVTSAFRW